MYSTLVITLLNTAFWFVLHFGTAELLTHLSARTQRRLFNWNRPFFQVSEKEMALYLAGRTACPSSTRSSTSAIWPPLPPQPTSGNFWRSPVTRRSSTN